MTLLGWLVACFGPRGLNTEGLHEHSIAMRELNDSFVVYLRLGLVTGILCGYFIGICDLRSALILATLPG